MTDIVDPPVIDALPPPPQPTDTPAEFDSKAFATLAAQLLMVSQTNASAAATKQNATAAHERATAANASAVTATQQADAAMGYRNTANNAATQAATARDEAVPAAAVAVAARDQAVPAAAAAVDARDQALAFRNQAETFATKQLTATSTTNLTASAEAKTLTVEANKAFAAGQYITVALAATPTAVVMRGTVTAYNPATGALSFEPDDVTGASATGAAWTVSVAGRRGASGRAPYVAVTGTSATAVIGATMGFEIAAATTLNLPAVRVLDDVVLFVCLNGRIDNVAVPQGADTIDGQSGSVQLDVYAGAFHYIGGGRWVSRL